MVINALFLLFFTFLLIGIPLFRALHLYELLSWTIFYSFLTVFIIGLVVKIISDWMAGKNRHYSVS